MAHGHFVWNELLTDNVEKAKAFYAATIGWTFDPMPMAKGGTYWVAKHDGKPVAGIMDMTCDLPPGIPPHWFAYLEVDDVDARLPQAVAAGARVQKEPFDIPGVGRIAILADATGAMMGWMTPVAR
jgi:uncharacterized protein